MTPCNRSSSVSPGNEYIVEALLSLLCTISQFQKIRKLQLTNIFRDETLLFVSY